MAFDANRNYDVRVHHWRSKIPSEESDLLNVQTTVEDGKYRDYSHDVEYDNVNESFVPIRISYSAKATLPKSDPSKKAPATEVGTIKLTWFQVNVDTLQMPKPETLGVSLAAWEDFVNPTKDPSGKDTTFEQH